MRFAMRFTDIYYHTLSAIRRGRIIRNQYYPVTIPEVLRTFAG